MVIVASLFYQYSVQMMSDADLQMNYSTQIFIKMANFSCTLHLILFFIFSFIKC